MREPHPGAEFCAALAFLFLLGIGGYVGALSIVTVALLALALWFVAVPGLAIGWLCFAERPEPGMLLGAAIVVGSGLYLLRHAKSGWDDPVARDFDRPLNERGRRDSPWRRSTCQIVDRARPSRPASRPGPRLNSASPPTSMFQRSLRCVVVRRSSGNPGDVRRLNSSKSL